jgi:3-hydroxyacyl-CoA dehydrogenase/enoyl-CoA hydratase/3-hydroxybutyryl-CoA epimerase
MTERMVFAMINEASLILDEGVVASAEELDLAMIMGTGFPPFRGGLLRHADTLGAASVVKRLDELATTSGARFAPSSPLRTLATAGTTFYQAYPRRS